MVGLTNSEARSSHRGWSERKNFKLKVGHGGSSRPRPVGSVDKGQSLPLKLSVVFAHLR